MHGDHPLDFRLDIEGEDPDAQAIAPGEINPVVRYRFRFVWAFGLLWEAPCLSGEPR